MARPTFQLYNSMTRRVEPLVPLAPPRVALYVCGPTVYNYAHIGNFRTYLAVDILRRALNFFDYKIDHVMQFTDVDDKTIRGARERGIPLREYTQIYREAFLQDSKTLHVQPPEQMPNATDHIGEMVDLIQQLIRKGVAYVSDDGSVYFRITSFPDYGCLCRLDLAGLKAGARVSHDEYEKEGIADFVLWKKWTAPDGDVAWDSPWGKGRPGWHIECSALSMKHLGPEIDLHGGGVDLRFPHHENEIAQSQAATGKIFSRGWFHVEHLLVDGQKMAKSLGNMYTVRDIVEKGYSGRELRYALLTGAHYRKNLNFTWQSLDDARAALARIDEWRRRLTTAAGALPEAKLPLKYDPAREFLTKVDVALSDDLNLADALGHLFTLIRETNKNLDSNSLTPSDANQLARAWALFDSVLGMEDEFIEIPAPIIALRDTRAEARKAKDFKKSDELRDQLLANGWRVKDTAKGQELTRFSLPSPRS